MRQSERKPSRTRSPRGKSPSGRMSRWPCKDYLKGTCNNSFCEKWHRPECLFYKTKRGCRFGEKCSFAHRQVDAQPTKWSKSNIDKSAVAMLGLENWQEREPVTDECHDRPGKPGSDDHKHHKSHNKIDVIKDIVVPSNVQSANQEALLYVFEDNEAVIKMIMKGRSLTMRHVSRTHRVALDWLFDRINLDTKIQIKYIDIKNQLADILTIGNFTRDEWNHLLNLLNIGHFSSTACTAAMAKRAQQGSGEERVTAKSKPMMNLTDREDAFGRVFFNFIKPGEDLVWISRSWEICCGRRSIGES